MSVTGKPLPAATVILAAVEKGAKRSIEKARNELAPVVASQVPRGRTGSTQAALQPRVQKTPWGSSLVVGPRRGAHHASGPTIAAVVRWVTRGTGLHREGPGAKFPIHAKRWLYGEKMILPGGAKRMTVKGQHANPFLDRIRRLGTPRVERALQAGAQETARRVERELV